MENITYRVVLPTTTETGSTAGTTPSPAAPVQGQTPSAKTPEAGDSTGEESVAKMSIAVGVAATLAKQAAQTAVQNIGIATGDYATQQRIQQGTSMIATVVGLGVTFAASPIAGAVALGGMAISAVSDIYQRSRQIEFEQRDIMERRRRAGYPSETNR